MGQVFSGLQHPSLSLTGVNRAPSRCKSGWLHCCLSLKTFPAEEMETLANFLSFQLRRFLVSKETSAAPSSVTCFLLAAEECPAAL